MQLTIRVVKESSHEPEDFRGGEVCGVLHIMAGRARLGLAVFNEDGEGARITNPIGDELHNLVYTIERSELTPWSPLAESLFESVRYFMQIPLFIPIHRRITAWGVRTIPSFLKSFQNTSCVQSLLF